MKRPLAVLAVIAILFGLTGCIDMRQHITVNADGSADLEVVALVDKAVLEQTRESNEQDPLEEGTSEAEAKGFKVEPYEEADKAGIRATKHYDEAQDVFEDLENVDGTIEVVPGPVQTTYRVSMTVPGSEDAETAALGGSSKLLLTLPGTVGENNADTVEDGTLVWDAMDGADVQAESTTVSVWVWFAGAGVCACVFLLVVVLVVVLLVRSRRKKRAAAPQPPVYPQAAPMAPPQAYAPPAAPPQAYAPPPTYAPPPPAATPQAPPVAEQKPPAAAPQAACTQCGNPLAPGARFCTKCGAQLG